MDICSSVGANDQSLSSSLCSELASEALDALELVPGECRHVLSTLSYSSLFTL